jgi:hypothetical protein
MNGNGKGPGRRTRGRSVRRVRTMAVAMNAWRGFAAMPANRAWPETCARSSASTLRAVALASATVRQFTIGLGAVRVRCLLFGHDDGFAREPNRLFLRCGECGRGTRGWAVATSAPRITARLPRRNVPIRAVQTDRSRRPSPDPAHTVLGTG